MRLVITFCSILLLFGCKDNSNKKPDNLINEDQMIEILYDMALIQAYKTYDFNVLINKGLNSSTYIYEKYKVDSVQLAQSNIYYASQIDLYEKMLDKVAERFQKEKNQTDSLMKIPPRIRDNNGVASETIPSASNKIKREKRLLQQ